MKTKIFCIVCLFIIATFYFQSCGDAGIPTSSPNNSGSGGTTNVLSSSDHGVTWTAKTINLADTLYNVMPVGIASGYDFHAVGNGGKYIVFSNGVWSTKQSPTTSAIHSIIPNAYVIDLVCDNGLFYESTNSGTSWNQKTLPGSPNLYDNKSQILAAENGIITYVNATTGWQYASGTGGGPFYKIGVVNNTLRIAVGQNTITISYDRGLTWTQVCSDPVNFKGVFFDESNLGENGFAVGYGAIYGTTDHGNTWAQVWTGNVNLEDITFYNNQWYAVGDNTVLTGNYSGSSWSANVISNPSGLKFKSIAFSSDGSIGLIVGK